ncbi:Ldh family oxidoreductase, partial [Microbacterium sp.]|uniref:Ldh family oxidoreductase n=1 Tax=Microbacterium sp. TaxID=51671 RepID=UPI0026026913
MTDAREYQPTTIMLAAASALRAIGVPEDDARLVAETLVAADRRGIYSHGLSRLPLYAAALQAGGMNATPRLTWLHNDGATAVLDADGALGQVAMRAATARAIELARRFGIAAVAVQNSTHYGAGNYWSDLLTQAGLVGIITSTTGPVVAPFGGNSPILGTNPLTIGFPSSGSHALTADMATSAGAYGKVLAARNAGEALPEGWAVGPDGEPTTDPTTAMTGALLTFGGHKGSALSVLLEALSASLSGANYAFETVDIWSTPSHRMNTGHLVIALAPEHFGAHTGDRIRTLQERVRSSDPGGALAPGDPEITRFQASEDRVEIAESTATALDELFERLGIDSPA